MAYKLTWFTRLEKDSNGFRNIFRKKKAPLEYIKGKENVNIWVSMYFFFCILYSYMSIYKANKKSLPGQTIFTLSEPWPKAQV